MNKALLWCILEINTIAANQIFQILINIVSLHYSKVGRGRSSLHLQELISYTAPQIAVSVALLIFLCSRWPVLYLYICSTVSVLLLMLYMTWTPRRL